VEGVNATAILGVPGLAVVGGLVALVLALGTFGWCMDRLNRGTPALVPEDAKKSTLLTRLGSRRGFLKVTGALFAMLLAKSIPVFSQVKNTKKYSKVIFSETEGLKKILNLEKISTRTLVDTIIKKQLSRDEFDLIFGEIEKRSLRSPKSIYGFLKDTKLSVEDIVKYIGIVAEFGRFNQISQNHPELIPGLPSSMFESIDTKKIKQGQSRAKLIVDKLFYVTEDLAQRNTYFLKKIFDAALAPSFSYKQAFEESLIAFYETLKPEYSQEEAEFVFNQLNTDQRYIAERYYEKFESRKREKNLVETVSSLLGGNLSINAKEKLNTRPINILSYRKVPKDKLIHNNTLTVKTYVYQQELFDHIAQIAPKYEYAQEAKGRSDNAYMLTRNISGINVKFIVILNSTQKDIENPFSKVRANIIIHKGKRRIETKATYNHREPKAGLLIPLGYRSSAEANWFIAKRYPKALMWGTTGTQEAKEDIPFVFTQIEAISKGLFSWQDIYSYSKEKLGEDVLSSYVRPDDLSFILVKVLVKELERLKKDAPKPRYPIGKIKLPMLLVSSLFAGIAGTASIGHTAEISIGVAELATWFAKVAAALGASGFAFLTVIGVATLGVMLSDK